MIIRYLPTLFILIALLVVLLQSALGIGSFSDQGLSISLGFELCAWTPDKHTAPIVAPPANAILSAAFLLGLALLYLGRSFLLFAVASGCFVTLLLYSQLVPLIRPCWAGAQFAQYATNLSEFRPTSSHYIVRKFSPLVAHYLGFTSESAWLLFLLLCFIIGVWILGRSLLEQLGDLQLAFLLSLLPVTSSLGWHGTYCPGYSDWALFLCCALAVFSSKASSRALWSGVGILVHERSLAVFLLLPWIRPNLFARGENTTRRELAIHFLAIVAALLIRTLPGLANAETSLLFYWKELSAGSAVPGEPLKFLSLSHALDSILAAYQFHLVSFLLAAFVLIRASYKDNSRSLFIALISMLCISAQLLIATDSVRILDLLWVPMLGVLVRSVPYWNRQVLTFLLALVCIANIFSPVAYLSRHNATFFVPTWRDCSARVSINAD